MAIGDDYDKGVKFANKVLGPDGMGRLEGDQRTNASRSDLKRVQGLASEQTSAAKSQMSRAQGITGRFEKIADEGMSSEAREAFRTKMAKQMSQAGNVAGLRAGAAMGGMKGASAAAQQRGLMSQAMMGRANIERDVFLQNEQTKMQGLQGMSGAFQNEQAALSGMQAAVQGEGLAAKTLSDFNMQVQTFDLGQKAAEKQLRANMGMGFEQIAQADRAAAIAAQAQVDAAKAQNSGGTVICTELHRQGAIDTSVWEASEEWGINKAKLDRDFMKAYWVWGIPTVNLMQKSKVASAILGPVFKKGFEYIAGKRTIAAKAGFALGFTITEITRQLLKLNKHVKNLYVQTSLRGY